MTPQPLRLFAPNFADHIDASTQVDRMPGTADAACMCGYGLPNAFELECLFPFCHWKSPAVSSHESEET